MRRPSVKMLLALASTISVVLLLLPAWSDVQLGHTGYECQRGFGIGVAGTGSRSQTAIHYRLFVNRFHAPAERNSDGTLAGVVRDPSDTQPDPNRKRIVDAPGGCREDVQGLISFAGQGEDAVFRAMLERRYDELLRLYVFYGLNRPLTTAEKYRVESNIESFRSLGVPYPILHLPLWIDGLAIVHNLSCPTGNEGNRLNLSPTTLSQIFSGLITKWNEPGILSDNPRMNPGDCDQSVRAAVRADASEQTTVFKDYLSKRNPQWRSLKEPQLNTQWPATLPGTCRGRGDAGVATCVAGQPGSIGYVSFPEAFQQGLKAAAVQNGSGSYEHPTLEGCSQAASVPSAGYPPSAAGDWSNTSLTDSPIGYPICSLQFGLAFQIMNFSYEGRASIAQVRTVKDYLKWTALGATQSALADYQLARLPDELRRIALEGADSIRHEG